MTKLHEIKLNSRNLIKHKILGYPSCKILRDILKVVEGRTSTNRPDKKKTNDVA